MAGETKDTTSIIDQHWHVIVAMLLARQGVKALRFSYGEFVNLATQNVALIAHEDYIEVRTTAPAEVIPFRKGRLPA